MLTFREHLTHEKYTATYQHWCPQSASYAGGDHLISAFREGWEVKDTTVYAEQHWKSGNRPVTVYHFVLTRGGETMTMPVIDNPFILRLITAQDLTIVDEADMSLVP